MVYYVRTCQKVCFEVIRIRSWIYNTSQPNVIRTFLYTIYSLRSNETNHQLVIGFEESVENNWLIMAGLCRRVCRLFRLKIAVA